MDEIAARWRTAYDRDNLKRVNDSTQSDKAMIELRRQVDRELSRTFSAYPAWRKLATAHLREARRIRKRYRAALTDRNVHVDLGDVLPSDLLDSQEFVGPFPLEYLDSSHFGDVSVEDRSYTNHAARGFTIQLRFAHDNDLWPSAATVFGFFWPGQYSSSAAVGLNFTMPKTGWLQVGAALQNLRNYFSLSIVDNFGLSSASLHLEIRLFVAFLQPGDTSEVATTIVTGDLDSLGADVTRRGTPVSQSMPYIVTARSSRKYEEGTAIQILAGCELDIHSSINDMETHVNAVLAWQLNKMTVGVVPG